MNIRLVLALTSTLFVLSYSSIGSATPDSSAGAALANAATQFSERTESGVSGFSPSTQVTFSSLLQSDGGVVVRLAFRKKNIEIEYGSGGSLLRFNLTGLNQTGSRITKKDQKNLAFLYQELQSSLSNVSLPENKLMASIGLLLVMIPTDKTISLLERTKELEQPMVEPALKTYICGSRGRCTTGQFTTVKIPIDPLGTWTVKSKQIVGDPASGCYGRCGRGCDGLSINSNVYTQECFNHDICTAANGNNSLGICEDEWFLAADSFLLGQNCSHLLVGKWDTKIYYNGSLTFTPQWTLYENRKIVECEDGFSCAEGAWGFNGKFSPSDNNGKFDANLENGFAVFKSKAVPANDIAMTGSLQNQVFGKGTWSSKHTSIFTGDTPECR